MGNDLDGYMVGRVMTFKEPDGSDAMCEQTVLVDVTDMTDGQIQLGFSVVNPPRRVYIRIQQRDLVRVLEQQAVIP